MRTAVLSMLLLFPAAATAHPGHGALEVHWHAADLLWLALAGLGCVVGAWLKR